MPERLAPLYENAGSVCRLQIILGWIFTGRNCGQGNIFTPVCHSVQRGGSASMHAGIPSPPRPSRPPPEQTPHHPHTPPDQADPPGPGRSPPEQADPPPGKQTPAYGLRAAGMHPTGMHSCLQKFSIWWNDLMKVFLQIQVGRSTFTHTNSHLPVILEHRLHFWISALTSRGSHGIGRNS